MQRKKLPIGIQTFREIREDGCYYVDKTPFALRMITQGKPYFLSRPRRFGKSLFVDTLKELFEGNQTLFKGLYAEKHWDWSVKYPVIRLSFGDGILKSPQDLADQLEQQLQEHEERLGTQPHYRDARRRFRDLILRLHQQTGQRVVVLVDEYDKPILDNLSTPEIATAMRDSLRDLYSVLKGADAHLKFVFLTGVSKFAKVNLFSELNNLLDITLDPQYSALCGYTDADVDTIFAPELFELDREEIRRWYNGYNWRGTAVYNPFDLLLLFQHREFRPFWFETGTPAFLIDFLAAQQCFSPDLSALQTSFSLLSHFDVDAMAPEALLWQTGYLTLHRVEEFAVGQWFYTLGYPNREVESALNDALLPAYGPNTRTAVLTRSQLYQALISHNTDAMRDSFYALFASIPADWYRKNPLAQFEGHYASIFYSQLAALGLNVQAEDVTSRGRIDLSLKLGQQVFLFEFKVIEAERRGQDAIASPALQQLIDRGYAEKYRAPGVRITLIGVEFSRKERNVVGWHTAQDIASD
ncbi:MAG: ATP-binding protein [Candidatus Sericytochromatia bacterium]|nr:ATP-binding protein [Candidatus Sericytochromatia bacterium]